MDKDTTKLALTEYLFPLNNHIFQEVIQKQDLDRYVKKLDCITATKLFVYAQLMQIRSYSDLSLQLKMKRKLQEVTQLTSISTSQLSRKWRDMDSSFLEQVFQHMVQQVITHYGMAEANKKLKRIHLVDASTIILCLNKYRWAPYTKHKGAVKMHVRFVHTPEISFPDQVLLTDGKVADRNRMNELVVNEPHDLNVFDRGYVDYRKFDEFCEGSVKFVTRLRYNADYKIFEEREVEPGSSIYRDATIQLGGPKSKYVMMHPVRLIECLDNEGKPVLICTNDVDLSAEEIGDIYRRRWQIELFFKWIKQHFHVKRCYGTSKNAVYNQILTAMIAFCLGLLLQNKVNHRGKLLGLIKRIRLSWDAPLEQFLQALFHPPSKTSKGRRGAVRTEEIFEQISRQFENGLTIHYDRMEYGDLI